MVLKPLLHRHLLAAHRSMSEAVDGELPLDRRKLDSLVEGHSVLARWTHEQENPAELPVITLGVHLLVGCAGLQMMRSDLDVQFGIQALDEWLNEAGFFILFPERDREKLIQTLRAAPPLGEYVGDAILDATRDLLVRHMVASNTMAPASPLGAQLLSEEPLHCVISCAMTNASAYELQILTRLSNRVAETLDQFGFLSFQPVVHHDPRISRDLADNPCWRAGDERYIAKSDLVVIVAAVRPAIGLGVVASFAQRYGVRTVVIADQFPVTPMLVGMIPAPRVMKADWQLQYNLSSYIRQNIADMRHDAELRNARRPIYADELVKIRRALSDLGVEAISNAPGRTIHLERIREILSDPYLFSGATYREILDLRSLMNVPALSDLTRTELAALVKAQLESGWDLSTTDRIEMNGIAYIRHHPDRREDAGHPSFWRKIARSLETA